MTEYKILGSALVAAGGIFSSLILNRRASAELEEARAGLALVRYIREQIQSFSMPLGEIIKKFGKERLEACGCFSDMPDITDTGGSLALKFGGKNEKVRETLSEFFSDFGKNEREEQIKSCDIYIGALTDIMTELSLRIPKQKKVNTTLCVSGALAVIILLL